MDGRRIYHARGKVLGGSQQHQRHDLPARATRMDYERWARRPGHGDAGTTPTACPTSSAWRPASPAPTSGAAATVRSCSNAGRPTTRCSGRASKPAQQAGYPLTDDVNGYRQEGFAAFDKNIHRGRRLSAARAYLHPVLDRPNLDVDDAARTPRRIVFDGNRAVGVEYLRAGRHEALGAGRRGHLVRRGLQLPAAAPAVGRRRSRAPRRRSASTWSHDLPGVGENLQDHLEVYIQYACKQPVSMQPGAGKWRKRRGIGAQWLFLRKGPAPPTTSRPAASSAATTTSPTRT